MKGGEEVPSSVLLFQYKTAYETPHENGYERSSFDGVRTRNWPVKKQEINGTTGHVKKEERRKKKEGRKKGSEERRNRTKEKEKR